MDKRTQVLSSCSDSESPLKLIVSTSAYVTSGEIFTGGCLQPLKSTCKRQVEQAVMAKIVWQFMLKVVSLLII